MGKTWGNKLIAHTYAAVSGVEWVALTDGAQWRIYNASCPGTSGGEAIPSVDIAQDPDSAVEVLDLLSKDNMRENRIQELWQRYFVDRQIHAILTEMCRSCRWCDGLIVSAPWRRPAQVSVTMSSA